MVARQRTCRCGTRPRWCVRTWPLVGKSQWFKLVFVWVHGHLAAVRVRSTGSRGERWCSDDDFSHGHGGGLCWSQASLLYLVEQGTRDERLSVPSATARVHETASPTTGGVASDGTRLWVLGQWSGSRVRQRNQKPWGCRGPAIWHPRTGAIGRACATAARRL